jgi:ssDNA-binding Zn-finger/Zn-ribbon topoisomerase 1
MFAVTPYVTVTDCVIRQKYQGIFLGCINIPKVRFVLEKETIIVFEAKIKIDGDITQK